MLLTETVGPDIVSDEGTAAEDLTDIEKEVRLHTDDCDAAGLSGRHRSEVLQAVRESANLGLKKKKKTSSNRKVWPSESASAISTQMCGIVHVCVRTNRSGAEALACSCKVEVDEAGSCSKELVGS